MLSFLQYFKEAKVSTEHKPMEQVRDTDLPGLIGKGAFTSLSKHPWLKDYSTWHKAWKHGVDRVGFHTVEVYPYFPHAHTTPDGRVRPETMLRFTISHFGPTGKVRQVDKYIRDKEPNENEKRFGPTAGWNYVKSWKKDE